MLRNNFLRYTLILGVICLVASGLLAFVYNLTRQKILDQASQQESAGLKEVFPSAASFEPVKEGEETLCYQALDAQKSLLGYAFKASRKGYSSEITTIVGVDPQGVITHIKILSQNETPGLGTRITEVIQKETLWDILLRKAKAGPPPDPWFQAQFSGKKADDLTGSVEAITGATISSQAVIDSVQEKAREVLKKVNHG